MQNHERVRKRMNATTDMTNTLFPSSLDRKVTANLSFDQLRALDSLANNYAIKIQYSRPKAHCYRKVNEHWQLQHVKKRSRSVSKENLTEAQRQFYFTD
mmetsp:Transcript_22483/g.42111  ORF Transcript_22483/g.42111 Transcript_22483/m.42111 type:complete len:99 (-) Transcript_22483:44-340(-)